MASHNDSSSNRTSKLPRIPISSQRSKYSTTPEPRPTAQYFGRALSSTYTSPDNQLPLQRDDIGPPKKRRDPPEASEGPFRQPPWTPSTSSFAMRDWSKESFDPDEAHKRAAEAGEEESEEDIRFTLVNRVRNLLVDLDETILELKGRNLFEYAFNDEEVSLKLSKVYSATASLPSAHQTIPLLAKVNEVCDRLGSIVGKIGNNMTSSPNSTIDNPSHSTTTMAEKLKTLHPSTPQNATTTRPKQLPQPPSNPMLSHHPTRLVVQFLPNGLPETERQEPHTLVKMVNAALSSRSESKHMKVVAASYNKQGNLILSTQADQTAAELMKFEHVIIPAITTSRNVIIREDKRWYKVQIDGVYTGSLTVGDGRALHSGEAVHDELLACNPLYAHLQKYIVSKPRWLRTNEELQTTRKSSLVFALDNEEAAKQILNHRSFAAFGSHCMLRAFQERPPVIQCRNCWRFDHQTDKCKEVKRCRLCGEKHSEEEHNSQTCNVCHTSPGDESMDTSTDNPCTHRLRCANCITDSGKEHNHPADSRRCPARLERYGTARANERRASKTENPWTTIKAKKVRKKTEDTNKNPSSTGITNSANKFEILVTDPETFAASQKTDTRKNDPKASVQQ